jgi:hypothetical protein
MIKICPLLGYGCDEKCINHYWTEGSGIETQKTERYCKFFCQFVDSDFK